MAKKSKFRRKITKWHKRLGLVSALFVILLSITGILLNHSPSLGLAHNHLTASWLLDIYRVPEPEVNSVQVKQQWLSKADSFLYIEGRLLSQCQGRLIGSAVYDDYWLAACAEQLSLYTYDNELIEKVDVSMGLPVPIQRIGTCSGELCFSSQGNIFKLDLDALVWGEIDAGNMDIHWSALSSEPKLIRQQVLKHARGKVISWEKLVLDIHAGRFLGSFGPLFMDLVALIFIIIAASGVYMWGTKRNKSR